MGSWNTILLFISISRFQKPAALLLLGLFIVFLRCVIGSSSIEWIGDLYWVAGALGCNT